MDMLDPRPFDSSIPKMLLADLEEPAKALYAGLAGLDTGLALAYFLHTHPRTFLTSEDIAYELGKAAEAVKGDLECLTELGIAERTRVADVTLYRLTTDPVRRRSVYELCIWQERWDARLRNMKHMIFGQESESAYWDARFRKRMD